MSKMFAFVLLLFSVMPVFAFPVVHEGMAQGRRQATLAQQKMCADQAKKFFAEDSKIESWGMTKKTMVMSPPGYVDHYDAKANVCYVAIERQYSIDGGQTITTTSTVFDAFERTPYGIYVWTSDKVKKFWQVKPEACEVDPRGQGKVTCKTEGEFNELVKKYFGVIIR